MIYAFDRDKVNQLFSYRFKLNYAIELEDKKKFSIISLYSIIKEALFVLRETLRNLLDKEFIQVSSFSIEALIIFIKKLDEELRFCVDYREFNAIT